MSLALILEGSLGDCSFNQGEMKDVKSEAFSFDYDICVIGLTSLLFRDRVAVHLGTYL